MGKVRILSASAGSGKTYNLTYEYVRHVIANPPLYNHILAVTFTNKATEEMKQRILGKINELAQGTETEFIADLLRDLPDGFDGRRIRANARDVRSRILHDYTHFSVLTIDKFFQRIIRSFLKELGISVNFNLELPVESLLGKATDRLIDQTGSSDDLRRWIGAFVNERIDDSKPWSIKGEIQNLGRQIFSEEYKRGLSSALPREELQNIVARMSAEAECTREDIVAKAASILELARANGLCAADFAYGNSGVYGYVEKMARGAFETHGKRVADALEGKWTTAKSPKKEAVEPLVPELCRRLGALCDAYDSGIRTLNTAALIKENYRNFALLADLRRMVDIVAREDNIVHISEINDMISRLVSGQDAPFIFEKAGNYYTHFMIDEFQDTSSMQWGNFVPLLQNALAYSEDSPVLLVGDVKQSIYRWRGGDWSILAGGVDLTFNDTARSSLQNNFRSRPGVVHFNNELIGRCVETEGAHIRSTLEQAAARHLIGGDLHDGLSAAVGAAYDDYRQVPSGRTEGGYATVTYYGAGEDGEALPPVIPMVEQLQQRGFAARDIAILVRRNAEGVRVARMLLEHKRSHPDSPFCYDVITQDALVIGRSPIANFVMACLRLAVNPADTISRAQYNRRLGRGFDADVPADEAAMLSNLRLMPPEEAFEAVVMNFSLNECVRELSYLQALHQQIISFTSRNIADIPLFIAWWDETGRRESVAMPAGANAITIDSIHRSKGLGYNAVIIPYCNWSMNTRTNSVIWSSASGGGPAAELGAFPVGYKSKMADSAFAADYYREYVLSHIDNLNLLYVALTRAKDELHIMMPRREQSHSRAETIDRLISAALTFDDGAASVGSLRGCCAESATSTTITFGSPARYCAAEDVLPTEKLAFTTVAPAGRMTLRTSGQRYFDDGAGDSRLSPRNYGVLMHGVFERSAGPADIEQNIAAMAAEGVLSEDEVAVLRRKMAEAMRNETVSEWFDGTWDRVLNENDIIVPGGGTYRPDRVMTRGGQAVVVDYKFGLNELRSYSRQISNYMSLLSRMGYTSVTGYIWYVSLNKVTPVN